LAIGSEAVPVRNLLAAPARLSVEDVRLAAALTLLQQRAGVALPFSPSLLSGDRADSCRCDALTVREALDHLLSGTGLQHVELERQILIEPKLPPRATSMLLTTSVAPTAHGSGSIQPTPASIPESRGSERQGTIMGQVLEARSQRALAGAQVQIPGTSMVALTNNSGRYLLVNVPPGEHVLQVRLIGYGTREQTVTVIAGGAVTINFALTPEALALDEVVVTGTAGHARRREVGNAISQINVAEVAEPVTSVDNLLQGRTAGMSVQEGAGMAGSGSQIRLRGNVSVALSNQPLIYIDGVRMRSDGYQRNAPIGSPSAGGNVNPSPMNDLNPHDIERIEVLKGAAATTLYGTEAAAGVIQIFTKRGASGQPSWTAQIDQGFNQLRPFGLDDNPYVWMDQWLRRGWRQNYSLSVSGGTEAAKYFVSGAFEDNKHVLPNDWEEKMGIRGNFSFNPLPSLQMHWNSALVRHDISNTPAGNNASGLPLNVFRQNRNYFGQFDKELIDQILDHEILTSIFRVTSGASVTHSWSDRLVNRVTFGYDRAENEGRNIQPYGFFAAPQGIIGNNRWSGTTLSMDYAGTLNLRIAPELRAAVSWGGQQTATEENVVNARSENFPGPGAPTISTGSLYRAGESRARVITGGGFFQTLFDVRDRYFLTLGLRVDGSSAFGEGLGFQAYPKVSASYVISDEPFWNQRLGQLKLRGAYGHAGRAPGAFDAARTWVPGAYGTSPAFRPSNVGNPDLGPERTAEIELGFDAAILDGRLAADFTYYRQHTRDALFGVAQIPSQGNWDPQLENVGELENRGVELTLRAGLLELPQLGWDAALTVATNRSKLLNLGGASPFQDPSGGSGWYFEGQPVPVIMTRRVMNPGAVADPVIESEHFFGPNQPTHIIGLSSTVRLPRGIAISARGEYMGGHYIADNASTGAYRRGVQWPTCANAVTLIEADRRADLTAWERAWCIQTNVVGTDIYPADFFKLRDLTLQVPVGVVVPRANSALFTVSARNWFTWKNREFLMMDPEATNNIGMFANVRSITEHIPPAASVTASLRVTF
jgi:TonB-dependent starch-binding outer membrane protein SusC